MSYATKIFGAAAVCGFCMTATNAAADAPLSDNLMDDYYKFPTCLRVTGLEVSIGSNHIGPQEYSDGFRAVSGDNGIRYETVEKDFNELNPGAALNFRADCLPQPMQNITVGALRNSLDETAGFISFDNVFYDGEAVDLSTRTGIFVTGYEKAKDDLGIGFVPLFGISAQFNSGITLGNYKLDPVITLIPTYTTGETLEKTPTGFDVDKNAEIGAAVLFEFKIGQ